ncbi:MAG TPA: OmpA family protein [Kofleriaceae bacterium]|nr:OmpA family protein [Kofleriaceae bacterium]
MLGCSRKRAPTTPVPPPAPVAQEAPPPPAPPPPAAPETTENLSVSDELVKQCKLQFGNLETAPRFHFNRAELLPEDRSVLEHVAQCVTTGPLQGRVIELTGRADPRGTEEYNLGLGARRAETVGTYLKRLGVPAAQLSKTTRGALDATGTDEASWRIDRRVDMKVTQRTSSAAAP